MENCEFCGKPSVYFRKYSGEKLCRGCFLRSIENKVKETISKYEMIKHLHRGVAVVSVWKEVCGGCHMNIPPQQYNDMQKNMEIVHCPNCSRFLYRQDPGEK